MNELHTIKTIFTYFAEFPGLQKIAGAPTDNWIRVHLYTEPDYFLALRELKKPLKPSKTKLRRLHYWCENGVTYLGLYELKIKPPKSDN